MKLYVVTEVGWEYNDQDYERTEGPGSPVVAYRSKARAEAEAAKRNAVAIKECGYTTGDDYDTPVTDYYEVVEVDSPDVQMEDYLAAKAEAEAAVKQRQDLARDAFNLGAKALFDTHPELQSFSWEQYAPYFNDGDPCVFSVRSGSVRINGFDEDDEEGEGEAELERAEVSERMSEPVAAFIDTFADEDLEFLFGDDSAIEVRRGEEPEVTGAEHS